MSFLFKSLVLVIVYLVSAKIALIFGTVNHSVTILWPSGGIALAAVLLGGVRYLPAVFIAAYLTGLMLNTPLIFGLGAAIGNTLETYLGFVLLKRFGHVDLSLSRLNSLFALIALGALIPSVVSALLGPLSLLASGLITSEVLPDIMWRWWRADVLGITFFTPLILLFARKRPFIRNTAYIWELLALWLTSIAVGLMAFLAWSPFNFTNEAVGVAWIFPALTWAGLRTGRRNAALIQLLFLFQALASGYLKVGVFSDGFSYYGLSNFWILSMLLATVGLGLAIISALETHTARKNAQHAKAFEVSHDGVMIVDAHNSIVSVNSAFTDITGYQADEVIGKNPRLLSSGRQQDEFYSGMWKSLIELGHWKGEIWNRRKDGSIYLERLSIYTINDARNRVVNRVAIFSDITIEKSTHDAVLHQAQHDFLTNLPNRLLFSDRFTQMLAFSNRHHSKFAVIYLDLDHFKPVNDHFGHDVGDQLLITVAERLTSLIREVDTVSRFGGDEFAILVSEVDSIVDVTTLANKILNALSEPFILGINEVNVSGSLGIALYPEHGNEIGVIMSRADDAMYEAKQAGNNTYRIAEVN